MSWFLINAGQISFAGTVPGNALATPMGKLVVV